MGEIYVMMHGGEVAHEARGYSRVCRCPEIQAVQKWPGSRIGTSRSKGLTMKRSMLPTTLVMPALLYLPLHQVVGAYIDPGTGSLVLQALIGVLVGAFVAIGLFWNRIKLFVKNLFSKSKRSEEPKEQSEEPKEQ
jgi:hypothetical protein